MGYWALVLTTRILFFPLKGKNVLIRESHDTVRCLGPQMSPGIVQPARGATGTPLTPLP